MARFYLPNGALAEEDGAGNVTIVAEPGGDVFVPDTAILRDFARSLFTSISDAVRRDFALPQSSGTPAPAPANAAQQAQLVKLALLVGGGFLLFKLAKG